MDLFDSDGIYLVIVIAVFMFVFFCMWAMSQSLKAPASKPRKSRPRQNQARNMARPSAPSPGDFQDNSQSYNAEPGMADSQGAADGSGSPGQYDFGDPQQQFNADSRPASPSQQRRVPIPNNGGPTIAGSKQISNLDQLDNQGQLQPGANDAKAGGNMLWSNISANQADGQAEPDDSGGSLMDIFSQNSEEEEGVAVLASKMENVDVRNLGKLSKEIAEYFSNRNTSSKK